MLKLQCPLDIGGNLQPFLSFDSEARFMGFWGRRHMPGRFLMDGDRVKGVCGWMVNKCLFNKSPRALFFSLAASQRSRLSRAGVRPGRYDKWIWS